MTSSTDANIIPNGEGGGDTVDVFSFYPNSSKSQNSASLVVHKDAFFYKMNHPHRGLAVIFNHEKFIVPNLRERSGTQADCDNLKSCWEKIGFTVKVHQDLNIKDLNEAIDEIAETDFSEMDCLVICVLSHGEEGIIYARDSAYHHDKLWQKFTADKCKSLAGKPKLFFIQACQGRRLDPGVKLQYEVDGSHSYKIPIHADFLIAYSTIPGLLSRRRKMKSNFGCFTRVKGFFSWRNTTKGSWFIQALCAELMENCFTYDLLTLLTFVNRRVATDFESNTPGDNVMHRQKQIPCVSSMLTRLVKFT